MDRLSFGFVLGYHGCDRVVGERLLKGERFKASDNDYDWLGSGIYFWEANPARGLAFAKETARRKGSKGSEPFVVGAVVDLGRCLDLTTMLGIRMVQRGYQSLEQLHTTSHTPLPSNTVDGLRRRLDCAVVSRVHEIIREEGIPAFDSVRGVFTEGQPAFPGSGFDEKTHIQIAVRNPDCIKGVFRVPDQHLSFRDS